eukprot:TRINITY_DN28894_c0_g1_i1.p3 TRINITY_DN28894_c0_g1~~TRINITY_DN28894_c0_g1_i1.p3  ORF type:complete len:103 (-),score=4.09 TRINITY_DN28894_c0_g1_i1:517-825(-)
MPAALTGNCIGKRKLNGQVYREKPTRNAAAPHTKAKTHRGTRKCGKAKAKRARSGLDAAAAQEQFSGPGWRQRYRRHNCDFFRHTKAWGAERQEAWWCRDEF